MKLRIYVAIWGDPYCSVRLCRNDTTPMNMADYFPDGLPKSLLGFFHENGECAHCGTPITVDCAACSCGLEDDPDIVLRVRYSNQLYQSHFKALLDKEQARLRALRRRSKLVENGGTHAPHEVKALHQVQGACCYYCASKFAEPNRDFQLDHLVAVWNGGGDEIENIVLACSACNRAKSTKNADSFVRKMKRTLGPEVSATLAAIHKARREWLKGLAKAREDALKMLRN